MMRLGEDLNPPSDPVSEIAITFDTELTHMDSLCGFTHIVTCGQIKQC